MIDLNSDAQLKIFEELLEQRRLLYVHFAPPCGTASMARAIKLGLRHEPQPLRSLKHPMGIPGLKHVQRERVRLANRLYKFTKKFVAILHEREVGWSVENPASSLMWITTPFVELMQSLGADMHGVLFHTCMFGAARKKQTALWTNIKELLQLNRVCSGDHTHAAWGITADGNFATSDECAYNSELCAHWAAAIENYALNKGLQPVPDTLDEVSPQNLQLRDTANKAILGTLPRGSKLPPLLSDFLHEVIVPVAQHSFSQHAKPGARIADNNVFPKGARLLQVWNAQKGVEVEPNETGNGNYVLEMSPNSALMARVGVPVDPLEYVAWAVKLVHPNLQRVKLPVHLEKAIAMCGPGMSIELRRVRIQWTKLMVKLMEETRTIEEELIGIRPSHLMTVLKGKRFGLLHAAPESCGYPDSNVALEASVGFPLVGWMRCAGVFAAHVRPPELHVSALDTMAASYSARTVASVKPSSDPDLDTQVWEATLAEVAGGTLDGPYDLSELPAGHVVSPCFGIRQGQKTRPIDNMSVSGINSTVGLPERLQVDTIDEVAAMVKRCMQLHGSSCRLVGRTYDLKRAYRQLGVSEDHFRFSWIAVWSTDHKEVKLFRMKGLPFGGTASVASFLRMSKALKELGILGASLVWSSFFDDFVCVSRPEDMNSADMIVRFLFQSTGWVLSEDPEKDVGFKPCFAALGVEFDLSSVHEGTLRIGNTAKRKAELRTMVEKHLADNSLSADDSERLRSRLMFAESQIFGRSSKLALRAIGIPAVKGVTCAPLTDDVKFGLQWMLQRLLDSPPREIRAQDGGTLFLFLDGACEPASNAEEGLITSVGAVLVNECGQGLHFFGLRLPREVTGPWSGGNKENLVFEAEVLPYTLALACWGETLRGKHVLVFIDNDGARHSWIRGTADSFYARAMIHSGTLLESELDVSTYFCRVPTHSNLADGPSRLDFSLCWKIGAVETVVDTAVLCRYAVPH